MAKDTKKSKTTRKKPTSKPVPKTSKSSKTKKQKKSLPPSKKKPFYLRRRFLLNLFKLLLATALVWGFVAGCYYLYARSFDLRAISNMPERSIVFDRYGQAYSRLEGENRIVVSLDAVSPNFLNALLAREDTRFYSHHGIDPIGILRSVVRNFIAGGFRQGASTITQQLARNSFPLGGKNFHRKFVEAALAYRIETELSKEEILEAYVNRIYFGSGSYGIEAASQSYFGKSAARLDLGEAATLAGLIRSPTRLSPYTDEDRSRRERNSVLDRMYDTGFISARECDMNKELPLITSQKLRTTHQENWAMTMLESELGLMIERTDIEEGGLKIYTTVDPAMQAATEKSLATRLAAIETLPSWKHPRKPLVALPLPPPVIEGEPPAAAPEAYIEAAAIALDTATGGIRAIAGSRDLQSSAYNRVLYGNRAVGSTIKPFVYALAFERGLKPGDKISDMPITAADVPRTYGHYNPANSDGKYAPSVSVVDALALSRNTASLRIGMKVGISATCDFISRAGINQKPPRYPSLFLGAFECNLKNLVAAYTAFSNGGFKLQPYLIDRIEDARGNILFRATKGKLRILETQAANTTAVALRSTLDYGTAASARKLGDPAAAAGKTGTTNDYCDAWFVGFDKRVTCGVWVGFDKPQTIMQGGSGAQLALPIWVDIVCAGGK